MDIAQAASIGDVRGVESCLAAGTSPDAVDADGHTPLWLAVKRGHQEVVESLLEAGANPDLPAPNGFFPLHRSASEGFQGITEALLRAGANVDAEHEGTGVTPLFTAIRPCAWGAYPEHRRRDGAVPLHWAAYFGRAAVVEQLLEHGADASAENDGGQTPLDVATDPEVRAILIRGTDIEFEEDDEGEAVRGADDAGEGRGNEKAADMGKQSEDDAAAEADKAHLIEERKKYSTWMSPPPKASSVDAAAATPRTVARVGGMLRDGLDKTHPSRPRAGAGLDEKTSSSHGKVIKAGRRANA